MSWEVLQKKQKRYEIVCGVLLFIFFVLGLIGDVLNHSGNAYIHVNDLNSVSLAILQIQATVATLTIAILSLLGGRISESYMGISFIDFALEKKPIVFKQKIIIYTLLILLCIGICLHIFELYNLVVSFLMISTSLVLISVRETYSAFSGTLREKEEIRCYLEYIYREKKGL